MYNQSIKPIIIEIVVAIIIFVVSIQIADNIIGEKHRLIARQLYIESKQNDMAELAISQNQLELARVELDSTKMKRDSMKRHFVLILRDANQLQAKLYIEQQKYNTLVDSFNTVKDSLDTYQMRRRAYKTYILETQEDCRKIFTEYFRLPI